MAKRRFEVVDAEPVISEQMISEQSSITNYALRITDLTFTYPKQNIPALQDISFTVPTGKSVAIVGPSGAGKSTIANLVLRFWDYDSGEITLGGESLKSLNQDEVRKRCALVSQNSYFFNTSIRENLRLAIARALLKDADILILDEPTANLDPVTEKKVLDTLFEIMCGKTTLLITHRLVGLEHMDEILVLDNGQLRERGTHHELLSVGGLYRRLWDLQNQILADDMNTSG
jgi:ATP-binding cassette, subfamily C, bacterial CydC